MLYNQLFLFSLYIEFLLIFFRRFLQIFKSRFFSQFVSKQLISLLSIVCYIFVVWIIKKTPILKIIPPKYTVYEDFKGWTYTFAEQICTVKTSDSSQILSSTTLHCRSLPLNATVIQRLQAIMQKPKFS